ncbi:MULTISPECIES: hypothetical protein [Synechococcales]|uniref:hypothetical protein n=1 Tax=unclassified Synechococcus TaxID=2626047 RepID=UPI0021A771B6|nr:MULTISPECIES: hypothetical protein [unclassified Synechococcus]MCT0232992.1 hypothetical protein [Synechococcus sp. CS-1327]
MIDLMAQAVDPLRRDLQEPILYHRIIVPLFNHLIGFRGLAVAVPGIAASAICLVITSRIIRTAVGSANYAFRCCLALSMTMFIVEGTSFWMAPDSVSHLFVLLAVLPELAGPGLVVTASIALLNDERALFSLAFLPLLAAFLPTAGPQNAGPHPDAANPDEQRPWRRATEKGLGLAIGILVWVLVRTSLQAGWIGDGFNRPEHYQAVQTAFGAIEPLDGWPVWMANVWASFKWVWIAPVIAAVHTASTLASPNRINQPQARGASVIFLSSALTIAIVVITLFNGDVWRSVAFVFPAIILAQIHLYRLSPQPASRLASVIALAMLATPVLYFGSNLILQVFPPLPFVLLRTFAPLQHPLIQLIRTWI